MGMGLLKAYRTIKFFNTYRKNVLKHRDYLKNKYALNIDRAYRLWTTIVLADAPAELKEKLGRAFVETELKKYVQSFNKDLPKLELDELVNVYEIVRIDDDNYGVTFGFSLYNNVKFLVILFTVLLLVVAVLVSIPFIIF
jgi:hypothetical protein